MKLKNENTTLWYFIIIKPISRINDLFIGFFNLVCYRFFNLSDKENNTRVFTSRKSAYTFLSFV